MTKIYPEGMEVVSDSSPLEISTAKRTAMIKKAKELLTEPMEEKDLRDALENYYIYGQETQELKAGHTSEHFTSAQLKDVVDQVKTDFAPVVEEEIIE